MKLYYVTILFCSSFLGIIAQPVQKHGQLKVVGTQLTNQYNQPIALYGISFGWSCFHPRFYNAGAVKWLVDDWKCAVVRAAMGVEPDNAYLKDSATSFTLVTNVVDAAIKEGVYVIIDWHSHNINHQKAKDLRILTLYMSCLMSLMKKHGLKLKSIQSTS
jgi:endoglucanase